VRKIGKFEILAELGHGAMGTVYRARDPILDRPVALKTVAPSLLSRHDTMARFQREARAAARLQHPNIVTIYELGEMEGTLFIAMELLEGMDLGEAMARPGFLSFEQRIRVVVDICHGLDYAHKRGVFHRDVKPANVRLLPDNSVKIVDFGIARLADSEMTQTGLVLGTPSYIAPEALRGGRVDHRADMWAVGIVLWELLSGTRPYEAPTIASLVYRIVHEPLPTLASSLSIPESVVQVVSRALAKDPGQRFQDMAEMALALKEALGVASIADTPLPAEARERACARNLREAQRLFAANDFEAALVAARRAQALEPSGSTILALVQDIEDQLLESPTLSTARADATLVPLDEMEDTRRGQAQSTQRGSPPPPPAPSRPLPTPVLTELRMRGAAVFRELATFGEPPSTQAACLSPVQDVLATSGVDGAVRVWDLHSRTRILTLRTEMHQRTGHDAGATCLAYSKDGSLLASGHVDGAVHLWHMGRGEEIRVKFRHEALVGAVAFSPNSSRLISGGMDSNLKIWDVEAALAGEARRELHRQPAGVTAIACIGTQWIVTGHANRILRVLDANTFRLAATLRGPEALVSLLCMAPDGRRLAVASHDRTIRLFDMESRSQVAIMGGQRKPTTSLSFFADGSHFATVAMENAVHLWDLEAQAPTAALWGPADEVFTGVALFGGGEHIAVALADGRIRIWGPSEG